MGRRTIFHNPLATPYFLMYFIQLYINVRPDLVPVVLLHFYWRFCVQSDDGYIQPKHAAGLHADKIVCRLRFCFTSFLLI